MRAAQGLPLCMEPRSGIYLDPVVVLDFQSLYPSMIIAYNLWYIHVGPIFISLLVMPLCWGNLMEIK